MTLVLDGHAIFATVFPVLFIAVFGALSWALSAWSQKWMKSLNARPAAHRK